MDVFLWFCGCQIYQLSGLKCKRNPFGYQSENPSVPGSQHPHSQVVSCKPVRKETLDYKVGQNRWYRASQNQISTLKHLLSGKQQQQAVVWYERSWRTHRQRFSKSRRIYFQSLR